MLCFQRSLNKGAQTLARRKFGGLSLGPIDIFADYEFGVGMIEDKLHAKPLVSVIVVDYNGHRFWPELLAALENQTFKDFELVVVENGERCSRPICLGDKAVKRLYGQGNVGFAGGVNLGVSHAQGSLLALLNNDAVPEVNWLAELVACMERTPLAAIVCSKVLYYDKYFELSISAPLFSPADVEKSEDQRTLGLMVKLPDTVVSRFSRINTHEIERIEGVDWVWTQKGARIRFPVPDSGFVEVSICSHRCQRGKKAALEVIDGELVEFELSGGPQSVLIDVSGVVGFDVINSIGSRFTEKGELVEIDMFAKDSEVFASTSELELGSGCSMLLRRSALDGEPFDKEFFAYFEDSDLCLKVRRHGWKVLLHPNSVVRHHGSATAGILSPFVIFHTLRNRLWVLSKHAPLLLVLKLLAGSLVRLRGYQPFLDQYYSLSRLRREAMFGSFKRLWARLCDFD